MSVQQDPVEVEPGQSYEIDLFKPEDAPGITRLFRSVYGEEYPAKHVYDPASIRRLFESGDNYPVVARTVGGDIVGHTALFRNAPNRCLYESGAGLVLPSYRNRGINSALMRYAFEDAALRDRADMEALWGEPVCSHLHMQKTTSRLRLVEMGLEADLLPSEAYGRERGTPGRTFALPGFRIYRSNPHPVYVPKAYRVHLAFLYSALDDCRRFLLSTEPLPRSCRTEPRTEFLESARVARVDLAAAGEDLDESMAALEAKLSPKEPAVIQVRLSLGLPWVGRGVDVLRERGYFLGGVLPGWFEDDGLLLQKTAGSPAWDSIRLYTDRARAIRDMVRADWVETGRSTS